MEENVIEREIDDFEIRMAAAQKLLDTEGRYTGLCQSCFDTGFSYKKTGKFWGIEYRKDGDILQFVKCNHGEDPAGEYTF